MVAPTTKNERRIYIFIYKINRLLISFNSLKEI